MSVLTENAREIIRQSISSTTLDIDSAFERKDGQAFMKYDRIAISRDGNRIGVTARFYWGPKELATCNIPGCRLDHGDVLNLYGVDGRMRLGSDDDYAEHANSVSGTSTPTWRERFDNSLAPLAVALFGVCGLLKLMVPGVAPSWAAASAAFSVAALARSVYEARPE